MQCTASFSCQGAGGGASILIAMQPSGNYCVKCTGFRTLNPVHPVVFEATQTEGSTGRSAVWSVVVAGVALSWIVSTWLGCSWLVRTARDAHHMYAVEL
jgi:hypothetical protein